LTARFVASLLVGGALVTAACGGGGSDGSGSAARSTTSTGRRAATTLTGTSWTLATYRGSAAMVPASGAGAASLAFAPAGRLSGSTGCNSFGGSYTATGSELTIQLGPMTQMACTGQGLTTQEAAVTTQLPRVTGYAIDGSVLTMTGSGHVELFTYRAAAVSLSGTAWAVTGVNNGRGAVESTSLTEALTATFGENGSFAGFGGCNQLSGQYTVAGAGQLSIGPLASTRKTCGTDVDRTESEYEAALSRVSAYELSGGDLTLRDRQGATQLTARPR
jgi:heat shock protein HslJ